MAWLEMHVKKTNLMFGIVVKKRENRENRELQVGAFVTIHVVVME